MVDSLPQLSLFHRLRKLVAVLSMALLALAVKGQELAVESFALLPNDMTARTLQPVRDANGEQTALIKVVTTEQGFDFDGGSLGIVKVLQQPGEIWVYVPDRARSVTIRHGKLGVLRNYAYPVPIASGNVYEMKLSHGTVEVVVKPREIVTEWFVVSSTPAGADVYLDDQAVGKTPFSAELPEGRYNWRVERNLYQSEAGIAELKAGNRIALDLALKPNFGRIELSSAPDAGAKVLLNGIDIGKQTPCVLDELPVGSYTLTVSHEWFETTSQSVTVAAGDVKQLDIAMQPTFGELALLPLDGVAYYVNEKLAGDEVQRLAPGVYTVEARKAGHGNARAQVVIERGKRQTPELVPNPLYGKLRIQSQPFGARIEVDGVYVGETPYTVRDLLVGKHSVTVSLDGYTTETNEITVQEETTVDVSIPLVAEVETPAPAAVLEEEAAPAGYTEAPAQSTGYATREQAEIERIVTSYYRALGGLDKLRAIRTYREEATLEMPSAGMTMNYTKSMKLPGKLRIDTEFTGMSMTQLLNNGVGVMVMNGNTTPLEDIVVSGLKQQLRFDQLADWIDEPEQVIAVDRRSLDGTEYDCIETEDENGTRIVYYFNRRTHLIDAMKTTSFVEGQASEFFSRIDAYTEVDGLKFPSHFVMVSATGNIEYTYDRIEVNVPIGDAVFEVR